MEILFWLKANLLSLFLVLFTIGFMVVLHELGHYLIAKKYGIKVYEFAVGFGPKLWQKEVNGTLYDLRLFPLGAFVHVKGLEETEPKEGDSSEHIDDYDSYQSKTIGQKIMVVVGGPLANYIGALLIFWFIGLVFGIGHFSMDVTSTIAGVAPHSPAQMAGLKKFDTITAINGQTFKDGKEMVTYINSHPNQELTFSILSGKEPKIVRIKTYNEGKRGMIGIRPTMLLNINFTRSSFPDAIKWGFSEIGRLSASPIILIVSMVRRQISPLMVGEGMMGPIGIGQLLFEVSKKGISSLLLMAALISVILGVTNLLPIPALDGMRIVFLIIGGLRGRELDPRKENLIHTVGFYVLMVAFLLLTKQDIERIIRGQLFFK